MFIVNAVVDDDAISGKVAKLFDVVWLLRSAGSRAAETTVCRL